LSSSVTVKAQFSPLWASNLILREIAGFVTAEECRVLPGSNLSRSPRSRFFLLLNLAGSSPPGVANVQNIYRLPTLIDSEDDSVRLENKLPKALLQVLSFSGEPATLG
jgi:hypothetical protein